MSDEVWAEVVLDGMFFDPLKLPPAYLLTCSRQTRRVLEMLNRAWEARASRGGGWADPREFRDEVLALVEGEFKALADARAARGEAPRSRGFDPLALPDSHLRVCVSQTRRLAMVLPGLWEARASRGLGWADPRQFRDAVSEALNAEIARIQDAYP